MGGTINTVIGNVNYRSDFIKPIILDHLNTNKILADKIDSINVTATYSGLAGLGELFNPAVDSEKDATLDPVLNANKLNLIPYHTGSEASGHFSLIAIDRRNPVQIYFFNPTGQQVDNNVKELLKTWYEVQDPQTEDNGATDSFDKLFEDFSFKLQENNYDCGPGICFAAFVIANIQFDEENIKSSAKDTRESRIANLENFEANANRQGNIKFDGLRLRHNDLLKRLGLLDNQTNQQQEKGKQAVDAQVQQQNQGNLESLNYTALFNETESNQFLKNYKSDFGFKELKTTQDGQTHIIIFEKEGQKNELKVTKDQTNHQLSMSFNNNDSAIKAWAIFCRECLIKSGIKNPSTIKLKRIHPLGAQEQILNALYAAGFSEVKLGEESFKNSDVPVVLDTSKSADENANPQADSPHTSTDGTTPQQPLPDSTRQSGNPNEASTWNVIWGERTTTALNPQSAAPAANNGAVNSELDSDDDSSDSARNASLHVGSEDDAINVIWRTNRPNQLDPQFAAASVEASASSPSPGIFSSPLDRADGSTVDLSKKAEEPKKNNPGDEDGSSLTDTANTLAS